MALHSRLGANTGIHAPHSFKYGSESDANNDVRQAGPRDAAGDYRPLVDADAPDGDKQKVALRTDTNKHYVLTAITTPAAIYGSQGPVWSPIANEGAGSGNVVGPADSVDEQLSRFSGATGKLIQAGTNAPTYDDTGNLDLPAGNITLAASATVDGRNVSTDGSTLDTHVAATANPHSTDIANLGSGTKAELIGNLSDTTVLLSDVVEDTSPSLGGWLDVNGQALTSAFDADFLISTTATEGVAQIAVGQGNVTLAATVDITLTGTVTTGTDADLALKPNGSGDLILADSSATNTILCERAAAPASATVVSSAAMTMDCKAANVFNLTLGHDGTLAITGSSLIPGASYRLWLTQDVTGTRLITGWPTEFKWGGLGAPTLSTTGGAVDMIGWETNGTICTARYIINAGAA